MISDRNKIKRIDFARMCLETKDNFDNLIWTDESSVQLKRHNQMMRVKAGEERTIKPAAKRALKVHVWAGISKQGVVWLPHKYPIQTHESKNEMNAGLWLINETICYTENITCCASCAASPV